MLSTQRKYEKALKWQKQGQQNGYLDLLNLRIRTI